MTSFVFLIVNVMQNNFFFTSTINIKTFNLLLKMNNIRKFLFEMLWDVLRYPENETDIQTYVYRKNTPITLFTNFYSFTPFSYKIGLIKTLFYRAFEHSISKVTHLLGKNEYPLCVINKEKKFLLDSIDISVIISNKGASSNYII